MKTDDDFDAWFHLLETPGVGRETARRLLAACGSASAVFATPEPSLRSLVGQQLATALLSPPSATLTARAAAAREWLKAAPSRRVAKIGEADYPALLLQTADPPLMLYLMGDAQLLHEPAIAIVGSRHATAQGLDHARSFGKHLAEQGWVVVSGLAAGIDAAAHEGAMQAQGQQGRPLPTVAVVGTGLDQFYPPRNRGLAERIAEQGLLISEYAPGTPPLPEHFPQRNRIIAGLTRGTLVVEAALRSGSLITARLASEAGREVFAIPGSIHAAQSRGCHALIKAGAKLVESAEDILEELLPVLSQQRSLFPTREAETDERPHAEQALLDALGDDPVTSDALVSRTGWPYAELAVKLLDLELQGEVARLPGGLFQRRHSG